MTTAKIISLTIWTFVGKVMSLLFNTLSRFVIAFLPRSKHLLILWLQSPPTVILEPKKIKPVTFNFPLLFVMKWWDQMPWIFLFYLSWSGGTRCHDLSFLHVEFSLLLSPSSRGSLVPLHFLPLEWYHRHIWGCWYFSLESLFQLLIHPTQHFTWCILHIS